MSRLLLEKPHSGTQHHVTALERTLGLINVIIIVTSLQKADSILFLLFKHLIIVSAQAYHIAIIIYCQHHPYQSIHPL